MKKHSSLILIIGFSSIVLLFVFLFIRRNLRSDITDDGIISVEEYLGADPSVYAGSDGWIESLPPDVSPVGDIRYTNDAVFSCTLLFGGEMKIGSVCPDISGGIILAPFYSSDADPDGTSYGIYIRPSSGSVLHPDVPFSSSETAYGCSLISERTYDTLVPCSDGIIWRADNASMYSSSLPVTLSVRVIRFSDYMTVGTARCVISFDDGVFFIESLENSDISCDESLISYRDEAVRLAWDYICDDSSGPVFSSIDDSLRDYCSSHAVVERPSSVYFPCLLDSYGGFLPAGTVSRFDITAVSMPFTGAGTITVYLAPLLQLEGFGVTCTFMDEDEHLTPFAYDFLYPFTEESLYVPDTAADAYREYVSSLMPS